MFGLFKKKLHNKILVLSALPDNQDSFYQIAKSNNSDFVKSLCELYNTNDLNTVWQNYKKSAKSLRNTLNNIHERGVDVIAQFSISDIKKIVEYDVVIIIAHHSDSSDEIEIGGECVKTIDFVNSIPENTEAIIDMTSCYSDYLIPRIKGRIPHSRIIGIDVSTSLPFRLFLLEKIIKALANDTSLSYIDALKNILSTLPSDKKGLKFTEESNAIHLGKRDIKSTVAAPFKAYKGESFIISVFIHKEEDKDEVELLSKAIDEDTEIRSSKKISVKIKKGDKIDLQLSVPENIKSYFLIDKKKRTIRWEGNTDSVEFVVSVSDKCGFLDFIGRIHVYINQEPQFDMLFKTKIIEKEASYNSSLNEADYADIDFVPFDKIKEKEQARDLLILNLKNKIQELSNAQYSDVNAHELIKKELDMCNKCIELISNTPKKHNDVLKVFISSTSDMKAYRTVIRERVLALGMYPDMYEMWGQGNDYPRDMCCKHVLDSDIFICILGSKYGFVEPIWNKSMTEIEYRIASTVGIPILIYIKNDYKEKIEELSDEDRIITLRQLNFIDELITKRMVSIFPNEFSLALLADPELLTLKNNLLS